MQRMDESFLSEESVIKASRDFVCIRLATYEDAAEAEFIKSIFVGRSGELENSVFVLLSPDTKKNLCRPGRSPDFAYSSPRDLATDMGKIFTDYEATALSITDARKLPQLKDVRLGLNVAACDGLPVLVCVAKNNADLTAMQNRISGIAFDDDLAGKFVYASTTKVDALKSIDGFDQKLGYVLIRPGAFGLEGTLIGSFPVDEDVETIQDAMKEYVLSNGKVSKDHRDHVRSGVQQNKSWKTEIPVTDKGSLRAMERHQRRR